VEVGISTQNGFTPTQLAGITGNLRPQYDVAADGRFLMNITTEETISPITVILNWKPPTGK
jgi:hypothetical protein